MTRIMAAALSAILAFSSAQAESSAPVFDSNPESCGSRLNQPIAIKSSTGLTTYISVNTRISFCIPTGDLNDPIFLSSGGGNSGSTGGDGGTGGGCGGEGGPK